MAAKIYSTNEQMHATWQIAAGYVKRHSEHELLIDCGTEQSPSWHLRFTLGFFNQPVLKFFPLLQSTLQDVSPEENYMAVLHASCNLNDLGWPAKSDFVAAFYSRDNDETFLSQLDSITGLQSTPRLESPINPYELFIETVSELFKQAIGSAESFTVSPAWDLKTWAPQTWLQEWPEVLRYVLCNPYYIGQAEEAYRAWRIAPFGKTSAPFVIVDVTTGRMLSTKAGEVLNYWSDFRGMRMRDSDLAAWIKARTRD